MTLAKKKNLQNNNVSISHATVKRASLTPVKYEAKLEKAWKILEKYGDIDLSGTLREMRREDASKE